MSEAPENIWAAHDNHYPELNGGQWWGEQCAGTEYTRADLSLAMVAAAYEDASRLDEAMTISGAQRVIRSRTPDDAKAALDKLIEDARRKAIAAALDDANMRARLTMVLEEKADELTCSLCAADIRAIDQDALLRKLTEGSDG